MPENLKISVGPSSSWLSGVPFNLHNVCMGSSSGCYGVLISGRFKMIQNENKLIVSCAKLSKSWGFLIEGELGSKLGSDEAIHKLEGTH